jgi:hypothetical protein
MCRSGVDDDETHHKGEYSIELSVCPALGDFWRQGPVQPMLDSFMSQCLRKAKHYWHE